MLRKDCDKLIGENFELFTTLLDVHDELSDKIIN